MKMSSLSIISSLQKNPLTLARTTFIIFFIIVGILFLYLNQVQPYYFIDEVFHIPQTLKYCSGKFFEWDSKITTLPGLYLVATAILAPFGLCNIICIRCINFVTTIVNVYLLFEIIQTTNKTKSRSGIKKPWIQLTSAYAIGLFPPLFFWFFLFYTDVVSVNMVLLMMLFHVQGNISISVFFGALAILMRQTNVIWVAFLGIERILDILEAENPIPVHTKNTPNSIIILWRNLIKQIRQGLWSFSKFIFRIFISIFPYIFIGLGFLAFLIWNKGIVVGDRTAHIPTIHIPQIFYFSVFTFCFAWPYMLVHWKEYLKWLRNRWIVASSFCFLMIIIIHFNTLVHPYVLADNRHYTFYVWNKFIGRYKLLRYLLIPIYGFTIYSFLSCINHLRFASQMTYIAGVSMVLIPQLLLEPRYYVIPYIIFRLNIQRIKNWQIIAELLTILIINFLQFFIFVNKTFYWDDQEHPQRISW